MSRHELKRIALGNRWMPEAWHLQLADHLEKKFGSRRAAMFVFGVFGNALLREAMPASWETAGDKYLVLQDAVKRDLAREYLGDLAEAVGAKVHLARAVFKKGSAWAAFADDADFIRECRHRVKSLKAKCSNKGVQL